MLQKIKKGVRKRKKIVLLLSFVMITVRCMSGEAKAANLKFAVVTNDAIGDRGFVDMAYEGIKKAAEEFGIEYKVLECHANPSIYYDTLSAAASQYDVIFVLPGYFFDKELERVIKEYPGKKYIYMDGTTELPGVASVIFKQNEGAFLAGVLAALLTSDTSVDLINSEKKVGFIGGADLPVIRDYQKGFLHGVRYADPDVEVIARYVGDHYDPAKGKQTAYMIYKMGADVIFQAAGPTGLGVLEAAETYGFYAIGVDTDQGYLHPGSVVSSMLKRVDVAVYKVVEATIKDGVSEDVYVFDVANGGIGLARNKYYEEIVPSVVKEKVDEVEQKIANGEIEVESYLDYE